MIPEQRSPIEETAGRAVDEDCLKLTTYFGAADRAGGRSLAAELVDLYAAHGVTASILLRGTEGFGRLHHLHSERLEVLSYDPPVVSIAVATRERIESILDLVLHLHRHGVVTLERARMLSGRLEPGELPSELGEAAKLTIYLGRQQRMAHSRTSTAVCELLQGAGVAGASVLAGIDGTDRGGRDRTLPAIVVAVGEPDRIAAVLPELGRFLAEPLMTLERVRVCKLDGRLLERPHALPGRDDHGLELWQKLTVYSSFRATYEGHNMHSEIVRRLLASDAAGATTLCGTRGYHGERPPHRERFFQLRSDVPAVTVVIDTPQQIARSFEIIDELTAEHGLVSSEIVPAMHAAPEARPRGGLRLARHRH
jgi:PII-like signaling protein